MAGDSPKVRKKMQGSLVSSSGQGRPPSPDAAFDIWLQRGLHQMFDEVAQEPIPLDLLELIEKDRKK